MAKNKGILVVACLFLILFSKCNTNGYQNSNGILDQVKSTFGVETNVSDLLSHFPKKIKNNNIHLKSSPPFCPPPSTIKCRAQFGDVYLIVEKSDYKSELTKLLDKKVLYKTAYSAKNIIINLSELRHSLFPVKKCNKWYANKLPIPYFESYDFGLGQKEESRNIEGETFSNYTYTIPEDLEVYVIKAEPGDFWKISCNENRPKALKQWQHGYSKGVAISDKDNKVVFWVMIW